MIDYQIPNFKKYFITEEYKVYNYYTGKEVKLRDNKYYVLKNSEGHGIKILKNKLIFDIFGEINVPLLEDEKLIDVDGYSKYLFSNKGRVFSKNRQKFISSITITTKVQKHIAYKLTKDNGKITTHTQNRIIEMYNEELNKKNRMVD